MILRSVSPGRQTSIGFLTSVMLSIKLLLPTLTPLSPKREVSAQDCPLQGVGARWECVIIGFT